jgi:hypothetical protein
MRLVIFPTQIGRFVSAEKKINWSTSLTAELRRGVVMAISLFSAPCHPDASSGCGDSG